MNDIYKVSQLLETILYAADASGLLTGSDLNKLVELLQLIITSAFYISKTKQIVPEHPENSLFHSAIIKLPENPHIVIFNKITL